MCLIVACDKKKPVTEEFIENVLKRNDDGFGMMWVEDGAIKTFKLINPKLDQVITEIQLVEQYNPYLHFRMRTHGKVDINNCHPYDCGNSIYLMHNGVLAHGNKANEDLSDTWHFINDIIKPMFENVKNPHDFIRTPVFNSMIKSYIGGMNRLVFMDRGGACLINHDTWTKIRNEWTGCAGLYVSNSYAWDEGKFRDPKAQTHLTSKKDHRGQRGTISDLTSRKASKDSAVSTVYVSERFKERFEEFQHPYYLDDEWNVWEHKGRGFKRRADLNWDDLTVIPRPADESKVTSLREVIESCSVDGENKEVEKPEQIEIPALVMNHNENINSAYTDAAREIIEGHCEEIEIAETTVTIPTITHTNLHHYAGDYTNQLINTWKNYTLYDIDRKIAEQPEDAALVLKSLLTRG